MRGCLSTRGYLHCSGHNHGDPLADCHSFYFRGLHLTEQLQGTTDVVQLDGEVALLEVKNVASSSMACPSLDSPLWINEGSKLPGYKWSWFYSILCSWICYPCLSVCDCSSESSPTSQPWYYLGDHRCLGSPLCSTFVIAFISLFWSNSYRSVSIPMFITPEPPHWF